MTDSRRSSPAAAREGVAFGTPPAPPQPRIWSNDHGTFFLVADESYWLSRALDVAGR